MKNILVPIDFSEASRNAGLYAAALARVYGASLQLLHVFMEPAPTGEAPVSWMITDAGLQQQNEMLMQKEAQYLSRKFGISVSGDVEMGLKTKEIGKMAEEVSADVIVMGMKGKGHSKLIGSTVTATIQKLRVPVMVIPDGASFVPPTRITFASDFDERTNYSCFRVLFDLIQQFDAAVNVVNVHETKGAEAVSDMVGKIRMENFLSSYTHRYFTVENKSVEEGLDHFVQAHPTDLLAMVAHRHNLFERLSGTLHTRTESYRTGLPLLILNDK